MASSDVKPPPEEPQAEGAAEGITGGTERAGGGTGKPVIARRRGRAGDIAVALAIIGLILVLGFAPAARLAARGLPQPPLSFTPVITAAQHGSTTAIQDVPVGLLPGARIRTAADVLPYAVAALGQANARALMATDESSAYVAGGPAASGHSVYPYRYPAFDAIVDKAPLAKFASGATALGAALTVLAAQPQAGVAGQANSQAIQNSAKAAYSVLNRARAYDGCAPQLDLFLLLAADENTSPDILGREAQRTESVCPHNPTPGWIFGQSQLRALPLLFSAPPFFPATSVQPQALAALQSATSTFRHLAAEYPSDTGVLTGLGDVYLRAGTELRSSEPFTARQDFRSAIAGYSRASAMGDARDAAPGLARALIGLGEPAEAARLLQPFARTSAFPGPLLELIILADETAHDFRAAVAAGLHLEQLGTPAYPDGAALFPESAGASGDVLNDASVPLSFGADRMTALSVSLGLSGGAGGSIQDLSFIPQFRDDFGVTGTQPSCASWAWRRDALLNGDPAAALIGWPAQSQFNSVRPSYFGCPAAYSLRQIAETQAGLPVSNNIYGPYDIPDGWQNLLRWGGDLPAAKKFAEQWQVVTGDKEALPALRLGEIDFLMHDYNDAAAEFGLAGRRTRLISWNNDLGADQAELDQGAALLAAGRAAEGSELLRPLVMLGTQGYAYQNSLPRGQGATDALLFATVSYYASEQLADYERELGDLHAAVEDYTTALDWAPRLAAGSGARPEVVDNNAALAYLGLGETSTAASLENKALAADPMNPVFLMTAGFIADRAGRIAQAVRYDRAALDADPGTFPAANDLGVELTREHDDGPAEAALRKAVGASPSYALGWFNLGVLESRLGPAHLLASQGAFAVAYSLDPALKERRPDMTIDAKVYRTALDLSKPLPPRWSFSQLQRPAPAAAAGLLAIGVLGLGLARASGRGDSSFAQLLDPVSERLGSVRLLRRITHPWWALAATGVTFLLAYLRHAGDPTETVAYTVGVLILAAVAVTARAAVARRDGIAITQSSWPPAIVFGLVTGAIGLPWAPLPVLREDGEDDHRLHLAAPLALAALSLLLFVESAWLHTPITQAWAVAALIMSASTLLPVGPLDGAHVGTAGVVAAAGVVGGALLVGLGLI